MIPDLYKDIKIQLYERATSPLLSSLVISWCIWNYKLFLVIFSSGTAFEKIARIETVLYPNFFWNGAFVGLIYPLATTAFFIIVFPYPARLVFWITRYQQMKTKEVQQKIEDETPLTQDEAREIRSSLRSIVQSHDQEISEKNKMIADHDAVVNELSSKLSTATKRNEEIETELRDANAEISRLQSQLLKPGQLESENTNGSDNNSNDSRDWKEILGSFTNLPKIREDKSVKKMRDILIGLNNSDLSRDDIYNKFENSNKLLQYSIDLLTEKNFITFNNKNYSTTPSGTKFIIEKIIA